MSLQTIPQQQLPKIVKQKKLLKKKIIITLTLTLTLN